MPRPYSIGITGGTGAHQILNGSYTVSASALGYDNDSINPVSINVIAGTDQYEFTIGATGTLTFHVSVDGSSGGTAVPGAVFVRCGPDESVYGDPITTDSTGLVSFEHVPFAAGGGPIIYYKQIDSADDHEYIKTLQQTTMSTVAETIEVENQPAAMRTILLTDLNYDGLPIVAATMTLS